jgi:hypothetical protein
MILERFSIFPIEKTAAKDDELLKLLEERGVGGEERVGDAMSTLVEWAEARKWDKGKHPILGWSMYRAEKLKKEKEARIAARNAARADAEDKMTVKPEGAGATVEAAVDTVNDIPKTASAGTQTFWSWLNGVNRQLDKAAAAPTQATTDWDALGKTQRSPMKQNTGLVGIGGTGNPSFKPDTTRITAPSATNTAIPKGPQASLATNTKPIQKVDGAGNSILPPEPNFNPGPGKVYEPKAVADNRNQRYNESLQTQAQVDKSTDSMLTGSRRNSGIGRPMAANQTEALKQFDSALTGMGYKPGLKQDWLAKFQASKNQGPQASAVQETQARQAASATQDTTSKEEYLAAGADANGGVRGPKRGAAASKPAVSPANHQDSQHTQHIQPADEVAPEETNTAVAGNTPNNQGAPVTEPQNTRPASPIQQVMTGASNAVKTMGKAITRPWTLNAGDSDLPATTPEEQAAYNAEHPGPNKNKRQPIFSGSTDTADEEDTTPEPV